MHTINAIMNIIRRELYGYFASPIAYVLFVIFLILLGILTFHSRMGNFFGRGQAQLGDSFFIWYPWLFMILIPAMAMRMWSEERRSGTIELLFTLPITIFQNVMGKYLAGVIILALTLFLTFPMIITLTYLGEPDMGVVFSGYIGSFLLGSSFLAIGSACSALSRSQVVSFILALVICVLLVFSSFLEASHLLGEWTPHWLGNLIAEFGVYNRFYRTYRGLLDARDCLYFISLIIFFLFSTAVVLHSRRAN